MSYPVNLCISFSLQGETELVTIHGVYDAVRRHFPYYASARGEATRKQWEKAIARCLSAKSNQRRWLCFKVNPSCCLLRPRTTPFPEETPY